MNVRKHLLRSPLVWIDIDSYFYLCHHFIMKIKSFCYVGLQNLMVARLQKLDDATEVLLYASEGLFSKISILKKIIIATIWIHVKLIW